MWFYSIILPFALGAHIWAGFIFFGCNISKKNSNQDNPFWDNNCKFMQKKLN